MTVNSKLTHYKIRQISTENKKFKKRQTGKMVSANVGKTEYNFICENQIMPQASYN